MRFTPHANTVCRADNRHYQHEGKVRIARAEVREYRRAFFSGTLDTHFVRSTHAALTPASAGAERKPLWIAYSNGAFIRTYSVSVVKKPLSTIGTYERISRPASV